MIEHVVLFQLGADVDGAKMEWMMRETRVRLLRIPCVLAVRCGKNVDLASPWAFFLAVTLDSAEKLPVYAAHPIHVRYVEDVIRPHTTARLALDFQTDPGEDPLYS